MDNCIWIYHINNCKQEKLLKYITISGIIILSLILTLYIIVILFKIYKRKWKKIIEINKIKYMEFYLIYFTFGCILRILYLILLLNNNKLKWFISLLQELLGSYILLLIISDINTQKSFIYKHKKFILLLCIIWNLFTTIFLSIYYTFIDDYLLIHKFIGIQILIWGFNLLIIGLLFYYYTKNLEINNKNVKYIFYTISIVCLIFSPIWIIQSIIMWINPYEDNNVIISIVTIFWYYGGIIPIGMFSLYYIFIQTK